MHEMFDITTANAFFFYGANNFEDPPAPWKEFSQNDYLEQLKRQLHTIRLDTIDQRKALVSILVDKDQWPWGRRVDSELRGRPWGLKKDDRLVIGGDLGCVRDIEHLKVPTKVFFYEHQILALGYRT